MKQIYALIFCPLFLFSAQRELDKTIVSTIDRKSNSIQFIENKKQWNASVKFLSKINGQQIWFTDQGIRTSAYKIIENKPEVNVLEDPHHSMESFDSSIAIGHVWDMVFVNKSANAKFEGLSKLKEYHNYFLGNDSSKWASNVSLYKQLWYRNVYRGIDVKYYENESGEMEYDFIIAPNSDYKNIKLNYRGLDGLRISANGDLYLKTQHLGELPVSKPVAYQIVNNQRVSVPVRYVLEGSNLSFKVMGNYNPNIELVIDPTLRYSTFLCNSFSNNWNYTSGIDVNAVGEALVTGTTFNPNFPVTIGAFQTTMSGNYDAFVLQLNALATNVNFSTFFGGALQDFSRGALYDNANNIVFTGQTLSTNLPILGGLSSTLTGSYDLYISKLNSTGSALIFSTYFGGASQDYPAGLALDNVNDIYICGSTYSTNFPTTTGVIKTTLTGVNTYDCFVSKINNTCTSLIYSTYLGGTTWDYAACLRVDKNKNAYICGYTFSNDYPVTTGAYDVTFNGSYDGFITKINTTATSIIFSSFLGGISFDFLNSIALDDRNNIYAQGSTLSLNYPFTPGAFKTSFVNAGQYETVVSCLDSSGSILRYSTALGKSNNWAGGWGWGGGNSNNIIVTPCGNNVIVSGSTFSNTFPTTNDAFKKTNNPNFWDQYITVIDSSLSRLKYSTFFGGQLHEYWGNNIAFRNNILYSTGNTQSLDYPITPNAYININSLNAQTPTAFSFENFCFLPDPSGVSINPSNFCNSTIQLATFKAKPVRNECTANLNHLVNFWYRNNDRDSVIAKGDSVSLMINPQDSFYLVTVDTFLKCRSRELKLDFSFGIFKWVVNKTICANDSFKVDGIWRRKGGIYYETIKGNPCDTAKTVFLTVFPMIPAFIDTTICFHEVFTFNNKTYDTTNIYYDTLSSSGGCDTLLQIKLTKIPKFINLKYSICNGQFVVINGNAYSTSGIYVNNLLNRKGCDSIVTLDLRVSGAKRDSVYKVLCFGESFKVLNKTYTTTGIRLDTLKSTLTCDSIIYSDITFKPSTISYDTVIRCETDTFTFKGKIYESSVFDNGKTWIDTVITSTGCSFKNVFLKISPIKYRVSANLTFTACYPNQGYVVGSKVYRASGHYFDTLPQFNGCDSVIETYLDYIPYTPAPKANFYTSICEGKSITLGNQTHSTAGVFTDTLFSAAGCDSILVFTYLTVLPRVHTYLKDTLCWGKFMYVGNKIRNATGSYVDTIPALNTCDSIIHLDLLVYPKVTYTYTVNICQGQSYFFNNKNLSIAGTYLDTLINYQNCDSFITLNLKVDSIYYKIRTVNLCAGEGMTIGGIYRTTDGAYLDTLKSVKGCDSVTLTNLFFKPKYLFNQDILLCYGDTLNFNGKKYFSAGIYADTLKSYFNCDSIIQTTIQTLPLNRKVIKADLCIGDKYYARKAFQTVSGTYIDTFVSFQNCDSIIEHQLQFYANFNKINSVSICQGDSFLAAKSYRKSSGMYVDSFQTSFGCDSFIITKLTVNPTHNRVFNIQLCQGEQYFAQGAWQTTTGVYTDYLKNIFGCDSIITTYINVNPVYNITKTVNLCDGMQYFIKGKFQTTAGVYVDSLKTKMGCDSVLNTTLNFYPSYSYTVKETICAGRPFSFYEYQPRETGNYAKVFKIKNFCDSVYILNLTVLPFNTKSNLIEKCEGEQVFLSNKWQTKSGTYFDTIRTAIGCDTILTTKLQMIPLNMKTVEYNLCNSDSFVLRNKVYFNNQYLYDTLKNAAGCDSISFIVLKFTPCDSSKDCNKVYIPTGFSPNGDGSNDALRPILKTTNVTLARFLVYNRWGKQVFNSSESNSFSWDGTSNSANMPMGVYSWVLEYICEGQAIQKKGNTTLLR